MKKKRLVIWTKDPRFVRSYSKPQAEASLLTTCFYCDRSATVIYKDYYSPIPVCKLHAKEVRFHETSIPRIRR